MSLRHILSFATISLLTACPGSPGIESDTAQSTTGSTTSDEPTTGQPTTGSTTETSTGETSTTGSMPGVTRILYAVVAEGTTQVVRLRSVEIDDGVVGTPVTVLEAADGVYFGEYDLPEAGRPHTAVQSYGAGPKRLWLLAAATASAHEVILPAPYDILYVNFSTDRKHLIVGGAPQEFQPGDLEFSVCEIGANSECALQPFAPALSPMAYVSFVHDVRPTDGHLLYQTRSLDDAGTEVLLGDLTGDDPVLVASSVDLALTPTLAPDANTVFFRDSMQNLAVDISAAVPGPLVPLHAPLADSARPTWDPPMKQFLLWNGPGAYGDLHHIAVDGAMPGPMQTFNAGAPMHVEKKSAAFSPDSARVAYLADHETPMDTQLYVHDVAAVEAPPVKVNGPLAPGAGVAGFSFLPDGQRMLYAASLNQIPEYHVFLASLDQPGAAAQIGAEPEHAILTIQFLISHDGDRLIYSGGAGPAVAELFLVDIGADQPTAPLSLSSALPPGTRPTLGSLFAPDDSAVFFPTYTDSGPTGLYRAAIAPEVTPAAEVSDPGEGVQRFVLLP